jgi:hypothetical protein
MHNPCDEVHGTSSALCDYILQHQLQETAPASIVDFGAGGGKIGRLVRETLSPSCRLEAVEGYAPSARLLAQLGVYNVVHHELIQEWLKSRAGDRYDLAIFGDVLEHLAPRELHRVLGTCVGIFKEIIIVVPLCDLFQGPLHGNPLEAHRTYVTPGFFDRYRPIEKHIVHGDEWTIMNVRMSVCPFPQLHRGAVQRAGHACVVVLQSFGTAQPLVYFLRRAFRRARIWIGR